MSQNTKIEYLYRDGSNWKVWNAAVVAGEITEKQKKAILDALDSGEYFIPHQVGLPEQRFEEYNEDDHCWFELGEYSFSLTDAKPTVQMNVEELTRAFSLSKGNWQDDVSFAPSKLSLSAQLQAAEKRLQTPALADLLAKEPFMMDIKIYQVNLERDHDALAFRGLDSILRKQGHKEIDSSIYDKVFEGKVNAKNLEDVYYIFNMQHPQEYCGRSLSVSDVVEVVSGEEHRNFYFCDTFGFNRVNFNPEKTQDFVPFEARSSSVGELPTQPLADKIKSADSRTPSASGKATTREQEK